MVFSANTVVTSPTNNAINAIDNGISAIDDPVDIKKDIVDAQDYMKDDRGSQIRVCLDSVLCPMKGSSTANEIKHGIESK